MGDALFVCGAGREFIQEGARPRHRRVQVVGREHDPFHADLKHQVQECLDPVEAAESVVEVLAQVGADRALQLRQLTGRAPPSLGMKNGSPSPMCPTTNWRFGYLSNAPPTMSRRTWVAVSTCQPQAAVANSPATKLPV